MEQTTTEHIKSPGNKVVKPMQSNSKQSFFVKNSIIVFAFFILIGVVAGFAIAQVKSSGNAPLAANSNLTSNDVEKGIVVGSEDIKTFKDTAQGTLKEGGISGEGAYHLVRPGGASQNVYLTSSVVDLAAFVGKNVKVWGKTFKGEKAGWLMDVGRIQVVE